MLSTERQDMKIICQDNCCFHFTLGRQHKKTVCFCDCEPEPVTLMRHKLWGSTPVRPQHAYHVDILELLLYLQLEGCVSIKSFIDALWARNYYSLSCHFKVRYLIEKYAKDLHQPSVLGHATIACVFLLFL